MKLVAGLIAIFPLLGAEYATYIGDGYAYKVAAIATDAAGNAYVAGSRLVARPDATDIFLTKLDPGGNIVFTATLAGKGSDRATAVALDPNGNIYVAGSTTSPDFPLSRAIQSQPNASATGFIVKFSPDGAAILYSTYFGGTLGPSSIAGIATDSKGNLYVTGATYASDFPVTAGMPDGRAKLAYPTVQGAFVAELSAAGDKLLYGGLLAGTALPPDASSDKCRAENNYRLTAGAGIGVDAAGNAYVAGNTAVVDLPSTPGALVPRGVGAFAAKIKAGGAGLDYLTYLDASDNCSFPVDSVAAIAVDAAGNAYLAGATTDPAFPATAGSAQASFGGTGMFGGDAFVSVLKPDGHALAWSTFLGGADADEARSIAVDAAGGVWISGTTASANFPNPNGWSSGMDFLAGLNGKGSALTYAARYPKGAVAQAVAVGPAVGWLVAAGDAGAVAAIATTSPPAARIFGVATAAGARLTPVFLRGYGASLTGRVAPGEVISIYGPHIGPKTAVQAALSAAGLLPTVLGGVSVTIAGKPAPLLDAADGQIDAIVPLGAPAGITDIAVSSAPSRFRLMEVPAAPAVFLNPDGSAAALNQDGAVNSPSHPAAPGSVVSIWATGTGAITSLADGQIATSAAANCFDCRIGFGASGSAGSLEYAGDAPGMVAGVTQINVRLPMAVGSTVLPVTLSVNGETATANVWVAAFPSGGFL